MGFHCSTITTQLTKSNTIQVGTHSMRLIPALIPGSFALLGSAHICRRTYTVTEDNTAKKLDDVLVVKLSHDAALGNEFLIGNSWHTVISPFQRLERHRDFFSVVLSRAGKVPDIPQAHIQEKRALREIKEIDLFYTQHERETIKPYYSIIPFSRCRLGNTT